ncbi:MAG: trigger factor [Kiloniellales bacterium]
MQVTETQSEGLQHTFEITVPADDIQTRVDSKLAELAKTVNLPGFRPGKVPVALMKQRYGQNVMGEVLEQTVNESTQQAMNDRELRPAGRPKVEIVTFEDGKDLVYKVEAEVLPDVEPMDFASMEIERLVIEVDEEQMTETLQRIAEANKTSKDLDEPRPAAEGDLVTIDFDGTVDGEAREGMKGEDMRLELGSGQFIPGFEDQLIGASADEDREVTVTFPEEYPAEDLQGKEAVFKVKVKKIEESVALPIDDSLAQAVGEETLESLRGKVRERMDEDFANLTGGFLKRKVLDRLADGHDFPVPPGMLEAEFNAIWEQIEEDRKNDRLDEEDKDKSEEELKADYGQIAERRVRLGLLLSEIAQRNSIEVSPDELNQAVMAEVRRYPGQEQQVIEYFRNSQEALANLRAPLFEQKVIDHIVEQAQVTERKVSQDEFKALMEAEDKAESKAGEEKGEETAPKKTANKKQPAKAKKDDEGEAEAAAD